VVTQAAPSVVPASPKTTLILGAVGFVALALQVGSVLFGELMSGRAVYDRSSLQVVEPTIADEAAEVEDEAEAETDIEAADEAPDDEADLADMPEPAVAAPVAATPPLARTTAPPTTNLANIVADMALGRSRIVLLAAVSEPRDSAIVADLLVNEALQKGLSVCRIDAGSGRPSNAPGLTDLCADHASFGDIVHRVREGLAEVPWGEMPVLDRRSIKPLTLVEALADIYEVVIVSTGRVGINSTLPLFGGAHARLVMARQAGTPDVLAESVAADAATLGFESVDSVLVPERQVAVA
jgi:hypothetical protein